MDQLPEGRLGMGRRIETRKNLLSMFHLRFISVVKYLPMLWTGVRHHPPGRNNKIFYYYLLTTAVSK